LITGEQAGGTWLRSTGTGGTFDAGAGTYTPALGATTSTFTYTLTAIAPCVNDSSVATVNINAPANAGTDGSTTVCDSSSSAIDLFGLITGEQAGGIWLRSTGTGGTFDAGAGTYTPALGATTSTFTYTLTAIAPCVNDSSVATVNINAPANAGTDGSTTVCDSSSSAIDLFGLITGEQAGGTWVRSTGTGGTFNAGAGTYTPAPGATTSTFTYTLAAIAPCVNDSSVATVSINAPANAGTDGSTTVCDSSSSTIDLFGLITGEQAGGIWLRSTGTGGTFNAGAGTYTPALGATTSTFTYTLTAIAPCVNDSSVATVNINAPANAGTDGSTTVCDSSSSAIDLFGLIAGEQAGGTWLRSTGTGGTFDAGAGTYTPALGATTSTFTYTLEAIAPCVNDSSVATVNINAPANAGTDGSTTVCDSSSSAIDLFGLITDEQAGGTWVRSTGTCGTFNAGAGTYTPASGATTSTFTCTLTGIAPCVNDSSVATVNINAPANAGTDGSTTVCDSSSSAIDLFGLITGEQAGGTWVRSTGTGGTFNAGAGTYTPAPGATTSTFTYTLTGFEPCVNYSSVATLNIVATPTALIATVTNPTCELATGSVTFSGLPSPQTWTLTRTTEAVKTIATGTETSTTISGLAPGTYTFTVTNSFACSSLTPLSITIKAQPGTCNAGIFPTRVTCSDYKNNASSQLLGQLCYKTSGTKINNVTPGQFFYYSAIVAPSQNFDVDVVQTNSCGFSLFKLQQNDQIILWDSNCVKVASGNIGTPTQGKIRVSNAIPGQLYVLSVKYDTKSLIGLRFTGTSCTYNFESKIGTTLVPRSRTSVDMVTNCSSTTTKIVSDGSTVSTKISEDLTIVNVENSFDIMSYPNPSKAYFKFNLETISKELITFSVFNILGALIEKVEVAPEELSLFEIGEEYPSRVYFVNVTQGEHLKLVRIIKE
jgi:hypothetical protein